MKPLIGITCFHDHSAGVHRQNDTYINVISKAGGIPILLPCLQPEADISQHLDIINGLILSGGPDADPIFFGEEPHPALGNIHPTMDAYEIPLIKEALKRDMPLLGICRGEQMLNIAVGGNLIQDIAASVKNPLKHRQDAPRHYMTHSANVVAGTKLAQVLGAGKLRVNSFHHQSVKDVPSGFVISATAPDGVIEAIESVQHAFVLGLQWHPEGMWNVADNYDALFNAFVEASISYVGLR
ncbi:MAG: gamma-glutamyl-gamma-aminobutyrate hydrolase family protein [Bacillota bacterium]|nr:gamma-glutamyl-gamma-aminobutyrate hydrolase family protein [Bacillota bacterium]